MMNNLKNFFLTQNEDEADIVVVNSCTVTNGADSGVRNYINQINKKGKKVILAGCGAFTSSKTLQENGKIFGVLGHSQKQNIDTLLQNKTPFSNLGNLNFTDEDIVSDYHGKSKAFLKIQEGCDFRCSYCIIPYVRGNSRSFEEAKIIHEVNALVQKGYSEFVLTGTNIGSYGKNKNTTLGKLLQKIGVIKGVKRVRLGSIEPVQFDDSFKEILDESWLEKHLHLALQHTCEELLKIMRRRNHLQQDLELFEFLANKGFALGTDFIVGHPGESEKLWEEGLNNFKKFPITHLHGFVYSKRDGTPSSFMKQSVTKINAKQRLKQLEDIVLQNNISFRKKQHNPLHVNVESFKNGYFQGYDEFYNLVKISSEKNLLKSWVKIEKYEVKETCNEANI